MPNGLFTSYKKEEEEEVRGISRGEDEVLPNRLRSFSLCFLLHRFLLQGFVEARAVSRNAPSASCSTSDLFPFSYVVANRHRHLFAALFARICSVPHRGL